MLFGHPLKMLNAGDEKLMLHHVGRKVRLFGDHTAHVFSTVSA